MTAEVRSVIVGGQQMRVAVRPGRAATGGRPPLLINGIGVSLEMLGPLVRELDPDVDVITFDPPGTHLGDQQVPLQLIMTKTRHKSPRYVKSGDAAVAEVTSLLGQPRRSH